MKARTALLTFLAASALIVAFLFSPDASAKTETAPGKITVDLTQQERACLQKNSVLTIIADHDLAPYGFLDEQGRYIGVMPDIAARLEELLGIRIKFRPMQYAALVEHVRQGSAEAATLVDILDVPYEQHYLMTDEVMFMPYALFVRKDSELAAHPPETVSGKIIALISGWDMKNPSLDSLRGNRFVFADSYLEAVTLVLRGKADAFFDVHPSTNYLLAKNFIQDLIPIKVYHEGYPAAFFVRKELPELHSALQKALAAISREERMGLLKKWNAFMDDASFRLTVLDLGAGERKWLKDHPVIRVGIDVKRAPFEFADADGHIQGLSIDYLQQFERMLGIRFEIISNHAWSDSLDMAMRREIDMLSCAVETPGRTGKLAFTKPYISMPVVILTRNDVPYVSGLKELKGQKTAVVKGYAVQELLAKDFPGIELVPAASVEDMFGLLAKGLVYACVENLPTAGYYLGKPEHDAIKVSGQTPYAYRLSMAVRSDYGLFAGILQKAFDAMPAGQRDAVHRKWMAVAHERLPDYGLLWKVLLPLLLALAIFAYWTWRLFCEVGSRKLAEARLRDAQKNLEQMNLDLDARVRQRTFELEQANHTLHESQERFRAVAEHSPDAIVITDSKGIIVYCNSSTEKMFGYGQQEMVGQPNGILLPPHIRENEASKRAAYIRAGEEGIVCATFESIAVRKDGTEFPVEFPFFSWQIDGDIFYTAILRDISQRKRMEESLHEEQKRLAGIVETSPVIICGIAANGTTSSINRAGEEITGYSNVELRGLNWWSTFYPGQLYAQVDDLFSRLAQGDVVNYEMTLQTKTAELRTVLWNSISSYDSQGALLEVAGFGNDITERKRAENEVRQAHDYLENLFKASPDAIYVTDAEGYIAMASESVYDVYGYHPEEIIGQHAAILTPEDEKALQTSIALMELLFETGIVRNYAGERVRRDGRVIQVESSAVLLKNPDGTVSGAISSSRDITDRTRLEEQLRQSQKMEAIGTLAGGIAHDFNNILGAIMGYTELSKDLAAENSDLDKNLSQVLKAADRAKNLVKQILAFSRKRESEFIPLQTHLVAKEALKLLRASLPSTISICSDLNDTDDIVIADPTQIHQIIMNLCTNAAHAMEHNGGAIEVTLKPVDLDAHAAGYYTGIEPGPYVQLSVKDTGTGIPADIIGRIFEPFFTTKGVGKGTGMGLAVVHGIVKSLRGDIKLYSEAGKGAVFHVVLPRAQAEKAGAQAVQRVAPQGTEAVLLVDDEAVLLDVGQKILASLGYRVTALADAVEAWELFKKNPAAFDLVITDQTMPGLTGYELAQRIMQVRRDIPVILCTGYSDLVKAETALAGGIRAFVIKPLSRLAIAETIRRVLVESAA